MRKRNRPSVYLKIFVTGAGLIYVLATVPLGAVGAELGTVRWSWLFLGFILINLSLVLRAYRWLLLLRGLHIAVPLLRLVNLYFVGNFFNAFLPSGFGGDAIRVVEVAKHLSSALAAGTVVLDRLTGLLALFAMALVALPLRPASFPDSLAMIVAITSVTGLLTGVFFLKGKLVRAVIRRFGRWLDQIMPGNPGRSRTTMLLQPLEAIQQCGSGAVWQAIVVSVLFNLMMVAWWLAVGQAMDFSVSFIYYLLVVPILSVATLVPSVGGLGVRESIAPALFAGAGLSGAESVSLALLVFVLLRLSGLLGAPLYLYSIRQARGAK